MTRKAYTFGLDIGIASVGYGVIDEERNIVDAGVRLFSESDKTENENRRTKRSMRRLKRRRKHRIERVIDLLNDYQIDTDRDLSSSPYELRAKGLHKKLTERELTAALTHLVKRRGVHNMNASSDLDDSEGDSLSTKDQLSINNKALKDRYVCELQLERMKEKGEVRGHQNRFETEDYVREARALLEKQQSYNKKLNESFIEQYITILSDRRKYFDGPGPGSEYGWDQDTYRWYEQMMGKCSYFPEELRAVKSAYSAQLYNALNDLNNLSIIRDGDTYLSENEKEDLIENVFKKRKKPTLKQVAKELQVSEDDIRRYRVNSKGTAEFTSFELYHDLKKLNVKEEQLGDHDIDEIAKILSIWQTEEDKYKELVELELPLTDSLLKSISQLDTNGTHSLSMKAIQLVLPELWSSSKNQMEIFSDMNLKPKKVSLKGRNRIPVDHIDDLILSPVVKRSFHQSVRVLNELINKYGEPKSIVIELAREKNSQDQKNFIKQLNKKHAAINKLIKEKLEEEDLDADHSHFEKLRLWYLQDGLCMYSLKPIPIEELLQQPFQYEVDHIIPHSVSFDDSQNNKVLVKTDENQKKGNKTPFQYLSSGKGLISYEKFKSHILQMAKSHDKIPKKKKEYLLEERNISKYNVQKEFINRNLVDTRYATRELLNLLKAYFQENEKDVRVKSINGSFTNYLRKLWRFKKDREEDFKHHAEDALVVAMADYIFEKKDSLSFPNLVRTEGQLFDIETGEIVNETFDALFTEKIEKVQAVKNYNQYKYSHRVDKKPNRQLMNDTLYSTRKIDDAEYTIAKLKDIYNKDNEDIKKKYEKDPETFLMYEHDPQTFEKLKTIMEQYSDAKNPLAKHLEETGEYLTKYSKKGNGPIVRSIKYRSNKINVYKDLTHKYNTNNKKVVALKLNTYRVDFYEEEGKYKFVAVRYDDLKEEKEYFYVDEENYNNKMKEKNIKHKENFKFSLYKNSLFNLNGEVIRFIGVNDDSKNRIEYKPLNYHVNKQLRETIGKKTTSLYKVNTDVLGNQYQNNKESLKFMYAKNS